MVKSYGDGQASYVLGPDGYMVAPRIILYYCNLLRLVPFPFPISHFLGHGSVG